MAYLIINSEFQWQEYRREMEVILQSQHLKSENLNRDIDMMMEEKEENLLGCYEADTTQQRGREYIGKEQVFGENREMKRAFRNLFNNLYLKERDNKQFKIIDVYYLVYIVEVLKNYQLFELTMIQLQKNISLKYQQILYTIMREVETLKETMSTVSLQQQIFDASYYEAIIYDELILSTSQVLEETVQKKVSLLLFMKQKHINLEELQIQLEDLLKAREELIGSISLMVKVNEYNHRLYDIYLNYLETLSFSETDIKLERYNRYQKGQRQIYFQMNSADACILFASLKSEKDMRITKVSNNLEFMLGYEKQNLVNNSIEVIMPQPYAAIHKEYVMNFFARGDTQSYLKDLILFANTQSQHIIPVNIDIKVNLLNVENEFGITAYISKIQKQIQYIMFDASSGKLISMTPEINQFVFTTVKNFNRVGINSFFPFASHFKTIFGNSSSAFSKTSQMTLNSVRTRQILSNQSVRSHNSDNNKNKDQSKPKSLIDQQKLQKQINEAKDQQYNENNMNMLGNNEQKLGQNEDFKRINKQNQIKSLRDSPIEGMYDENDDRRYRNVSYLLVINTSNNLFMSMKSRRVQGLSDFKFFTMNLNLYTCPSPGLENIKYLEISQIKSINPLHNSKFIIQIYNDEIEGFLTNLHSFRTSDIQCIITELEAKGIKESNRHANINGQNIYDENEDDEEEQEEVIDLINSNKFADNPEVLYNRYASNQQKYSSDVINQLYGKKGSQEDLDKSTNFGMVESVFNQKKDHTDHNSKYVKGKEHYDQSINPNLNKQSTKQEINESLNQINIEKQKNPDQSTAQMLKQNSADISTSFQIGSLKNPHNNNFDNNESSYYPQVKQVDADINNQINLDHIDEKETTINPFSMMSPAYQTGVDIKAGLAYANLIQQDSSNHLNLKRNNDQSINMFPNFLSPKETSTSQQIFQGRTLALLSPGIHRGSAQQILFSPDRNTQLIQSPSVLNNSQQMNDLIVKSNRNQQPARQASVSVHSLSKKRKKILAAHKKEIKNLKEALDSSSNHSRESTASSTRKATKSIILQKSTLGVMKLVNVIGIASFLIILIVILQQYLSMSQQFDEYAKDLDFVNWSSSYQISLSLVMKNYNLNKLLDNTIINAPAKIKAEMQTQAKSDLLNSVTDIAELLQRLSTASTDRQIVQKMLNKNYYFKLGALVNHDKSLVGQPSNYFFNTVKYDVSIYIGSHLLFASLFRYSKALGTGTAQFIAVSNSEAIVESLQQVSKDCQEFSINQLTKIEGDVDNVLIIICLVTAFCIFIIIPVYSFIQTKREQIIQLFGTFNSGFIDNSIHEIQKIYSRNNSIKAITIQNYNENNQKRQNLSSTSRLNRVNKTVIVIAFIIFVLTLPYPILNKVLSTSYIRQNKDSLPLLGNYLFLFIVLYFYLIQPSLFHPLTKLKLFYHKLLNTASIKYSSFQQKTTDTLYNLQAFIQDDTSLSFFSIVLKIQTTNTGFDFSTYKPIVQANVIKSTTVQTELQVMLQKSRNAEVYNRDTYNNYFMKTFEDDACGNIFKYPQYLTLNDTLTITDCKKVASGILNKGLSIAIKSFFQVLSDLQEVLIEEDLTIFKQKFNLFQSANNLQEFVQFQVYLVEIIDALSVYIKSESNVHKSDLQNILLGLLLYQFFMMGLIFYFGWIIFYKNMDHYLYKTKLYLAVLNISYLIQNPYIQNYLHKSLS